MFFSRGERDLDALLLRQAGVDHGAQTFVLRGRDAAGPPVDDQSVLERGEVAAGDDVVPPDLDPGAQGFQDAAPELVSERVVAEEGRGGPVRSRA